ncbi:MobC family plasmid mobilization relaxosome protein [Actinacidiphila glaucinigra]|uniref:MobC family plasmid mobilization relaxosome protein n=1 Tax=Actinacidiphila glaucinigra TaxID=235986 RepID=UPI0036C9A64A
MDEPSTAEDARRRRVRRREREPGGPRSTRFKVTYNRAELALVEQAADRENQALAAYVARSALAVAKEAVVPVSVDAREVLQELIQSRGQLRRIGNNLNQIAHVLNSDGDITDEHLKAVLARVHAAVRHVDEATLQVMRERRPRS